MTAGVLEGGSEEGETQAAATCREGTALCPQEGREVTVVPAGGRWERLRENLRCRSAGWKRQGSKRTALMAGRRLN